MQEGTWLTEGVFGKPTLTTLARSNRKGGEEMNEGAVVNVMEERRQ